MPEVGWKSVSVDIVVEERAGSDVSRYPGSPDEVLGDRHSYRPKA